jgi:hypothetical protein
MSFFEDASLVLIPSAYKDQKVYSVKPTDGTGDLTFSRASSATRVQSDGLIEKVRTNLVLQSNTFSNASWTKTDSTVTGGQSGYDGTTNAWLLSKSAANGRASQSVNTSDLKTFSLYAKAGTNNWVAITFTQAESFSYFDLSNGTLGGSVGTDIVARTITSVGNGWYRISISVNNTSTNVNIYVADSNGSVAGTSGNILIQAAQIGAGDIATDYIATTTAAVSVGPVSGLPRLDYLGSTCPRLLLEPQRSNLVLYSEQMTLWTNGSGTMTANQLASPDGAVNADKFDNLGDCSTFVTAANAAHTFSLFVKQGTSPSASIDMSDGATGDAITTFTFATKSFSGTSAGGSWTSPSTAYQDYGNGWYRISLTCTKGAGSSIGHKIIASGSGYTYVWGAQLELGAYATSYIPTLGASVTRVADAASKTGITSLIGQTEGVIFIDFVASAKNADTGGAFSVLLTAGVAGTNFQIYTASNNLRFFKEPNTIDFASSVNLVEGQRYKIAYAYKAGQYAFYVNGVQEGTSTNGSVPAVSSIYINQFSNGTYQAQNKFNQTLLFPTRLTNAQLAELTA